MSWTDERVEQLKKLWNQGLSASQIAAEVADVGFGLLKAPVKRVTTPNVAIPYAPNAEARVLPNADTIINTCRGLLGRAAA